MEINEVFSAEPVGIEALLREPGRCYYVPVYQRPYSWDNTHIDRLISDISHGVNQLTATDDAITFLGTIITIHDTQYSTVDPKVVGQLPPKVMTVIDGQQRLTTFLILIAALHDELTTRWPKIQKAETKTPELAWLSTTTQEVFLVLAKMLEDDRDFGQHRFYPRMIKALEDQWSRDAAYAVYQSPIGSFVAAYGEHARTKPNSAFPANGDSNVRARFTRIRKLLRSSVATLNQDDDEVQFPTVEDLLDAQHISKGLFQGSVPPEIRSYLTSGAAETKPAKELFRLLVFAKYFLRRVAVTMVIGKSEEYAFDMFEALNTTGEPLTAIETFKPRVIRAEGHALYEDSESRVSMLRVESFLERFDTAPARQTATADLLLPFALAESGERLSRRLTEQRRFLMSRYDELDDVTEKRRFIHNMAQVATVLDEVWRPSGGGPPNLAPFTDSETRLCLAVLRSANHHIVLAPLVRLFGLYRAGTLQESEIRTAARAMTAFFALWRGAFGGTANIDSVYRDLMSSGDEAVGVPPFARRPRIPFDKQLPVSAESLQRFLRTRLEERGIANLSDWVTRAAEVAVYSASKPLTRLLLLAATHDSVPDPTHPGLQKKGTNGVLPLLTYERWSDEGTLSIEHVAPQAGPADWNPSIYANDEVIHRLGNLVLVPVGENAGLSNLGWITKRASYRVLSATSPDDADSAKAEAAAAGIKLPPSILAAADYRPVAASVSVLSGDWDTEIISARSKRIAELAWTRLAPWLGI